MSIKKGNTNIGAIYKGTTQIARVYKGTKLLFENAVWLNYLFEHIYYSLIPQTVSGKTVSNKAGISKIYGNGVVENQLIDFDNTNFYNDNQTVYTLAKDNSNKTITLTGTASGSVNNKMVCYFNCVANHKYLFVYDIVSSIAFDLIYSDATFNGTNVFSNVTSVSANTKTRVVMEYTAISTESAIWRIARGLASWSVGDTMVFSNIQVIDLTLMFGTGNEPTTLTDNRIQALLNRGYIPYNTGSYKNSRVGEIECEPYNLFDGEMEQGRWDSDGANSNDATAIRSKNFIKVQSGKQYTLDISQLGINETISQLAIMECQTNSIGTHDSATRRLTSSGPTFSVTLKDTTKFIMFYIKYAANVSVPTNPQICFHLTGTRTGYAPYQAPTKITLNGLLELNGAINSHDTFEITKTDYVFTRKVGVVDLGSLSWTSTNYGYSSRIETAKPDNTNSIAENYAYSSNFRTEANTWGWATDYIGVNTTSTPTGKLIYELATPQVITIPKKHLGCVDLGSLNWYYQNDWQGSKKRFFAYFNKMKAPSSSAIVGNIFTNKYKTIESNSFYSNNENLTIAQVSGGNDGYIELRDDAYTSAADFKSAMAGVYLFYETNAEVSDFNDIAQINAGGSITSNWFSWIRNQLISDNFDSVSNYWSKNRLTQTVSNNVATFTINSNAYAYGSVYHNFAAGTLIKGHKYLAYCYVKRNTGLANKFRMYWHDFSVTTINIGSSNVWYLLGGIITQTREDNLSTNGFDIGFMFSSTSDIVVNTDSFDMKCPQVIDLTQAFGAGKEPTDISDPRIQYIINNGYIPYDTGTDESVNSEVLPNVEMSIKCK